ncbi:MAG: hypothetical protein MI745_07085, partial [Pseudomonadales bacterium]|nr:hypothetical protein [Pseudomonadales bacterium]
MSRLQGRLALFFWLTLSAFPLFAAPLPVLVVGQEGPFRAGFVQALQEDGSVPVELVRDEEQAELVIALGDAAFSKARDLDKPLLGVYVSRSLSDRFQRKGCYCSAIWAGVALADQLAMLERMMPLARRVGVIFGAESAWTAGEVQDYRGPLGLVPLPVSGQDALGGVLRDRLDDLDAIVLPVDKPLFDVSVAKLILLTSYRQRKPVFGPDQAYVQAGSAASLYASGADLVAETRVH